LTAVKKEDYLLASLIFVGYLVAALVVVVIIGLIGGGAGILGFFVGVLFTVGVYQTWKNMPGRSRTSGKSQAQP
jgi:predicted PurR-regulated permease PerM